MEIYSNLRAKAPHNISTSIGHFKCYSLLGVNHRLQMAQIKKVKRQMPLIPQFIRRVSTLSSAKP